MKNIVLQLYIALMLFMASCKEKETIVEVVNPANIDRVIETVKVTLPVDHLPYIIIDQATKEEVLSQIIEVKGERQILFQVQLKANEKRNYVLQQGETSIGEDNVKTYARFVPERTDDYTWENDKVAFRTYGPEAQRMVEENIEGGTLSSGIDCWLKKVDYSIINKWYKGYETDHLYYHSDHGEGLDNYHVGPSRGCGGTGVYIDGKIYAAYNFTAYNTIYSGPVSTQFELDYAPYTAGDKEVKERKVMSIDLGASVTKFVVYVEGVDTLTAGVTLHEKKGVLKLNDEKGWVSYQEPHFGTELSTGIVADPKYYAGESKMMSEEADNSHGLVHLKVVDGKVEFYSGFYWTGASVFNNNEEWENYLTTFADCLANPLTVTVK